MFSGFIVVLILGCLTTFMSGLSALCDVGALFSGNGIRQPQGRLWFYSVALFALACAFWSIAYRYNSLSYAVGFL